MEAGAQGLSGRTRPGEAWRRAGWIVAAWAGSRLALSFIGWAASLRIPGGRPAQPWPMSQAPLLFTMWDRYDAQWYLEIARYGYSGFPVRSHYSPEAFFPLYPLLIGVGERLTGVDGAVVGVLLSNLFLLLGLVLLERLVERRFGPRVARRAVLLLLLFPTAFYFSAIYTEALFLFASVAAFWAAERERWTWAGLAGAAAALTRNLGALLLLPLAWLAWERYGAVGPAVRRAAPLLLIPLAFAAWAVFLWQSTGDPLRFLHAESGWNRHLSPPWAGLATAFQRVVTPPPPSRWPAGVYVSAWRPQFAPLYSTIDGLAAAGGLLLALLGRRWGQPWPWVAWALLGLLIPMSAPTLHSMTPLASMSRYVVVLFPLMVTLAQAAERRPWLETALLAGLPLVQAFFFTLFTTWNWIA
ncbi:MAG: mannosyltransferase family protein [Bacillota bacterium]|nr:mannosyltransferase family protein [Bacillota bacterium]